MYGCHSLQLNDRDGNPATNVQPIWGGVVNPANSVCPQPAVPVPVNPQALNAVAIPQHVRRLQEDLRTLGFGVVGAPSGTFDRFTFWAVREFQIYASMATVAQIQPGAAANLQQGAHLVTALGEDTAANQSHYVGSLQAVANNGNGRYAGRISGVVNAATRTALEHWLQQNFRCPVIVEAWRVQAGNRTTLLASNVWRHNELANSAPRFFVRDFSGYYTLPTTRNAADLHVIGDFVTYLTWSGPRSLPPNHTWTEAEMLPAALVGNAAPAGATLSSYKVVRSVAEVECLGFFDSVNCYDNAFVSCGPCHWTLGIVDGAGVFSEGELCGYLAYLRHADNAAFLTTFENFGVRIDENWVDANGVGNGSALFSSGQRKYTGWVSMPNDAGVFARFSTAEADGNYFKTWHWHYRFVMAGRCVAGYRERMSHMARVRLRDILNVPWGTGVAAVTVSPSVTRPTTIADVFTSEKAVALILRWHIRFPAQVVSNGNPGQRLRNALANAKAAATTLVWTGDPTAWTDAHETALIDGLVAAAPAGVQAAFTYIRNWPDWLTGPNPRGYTLAAPVASALLETRSSFQLDTAGLPPAP